jgi:hypothetical protein
VVTVATRDYGKPLLSELTAAEIAALEERIEAAGQKRQGAPAPAASASRSGSRK